MTLYHAFLFLVYLVTTVSLSVSPTWLTSSYVQADTNFVIDALQTGIPVGLSLTPTATMTFVNPFMSIPNLGYGICGYEGNDYMASEYFEVNKTSLSGTAFSVMVQISGITNIWLLGVRYIAISPDFPHHLNSFDNVPVSYGSILVNISNRSPSLQYYTNVINYTDQAAAQGYAFNKFAMPYDNFKILIFMTSLFQGGMQDNDTYKNPLTLKVDI
jgi:hypothetical protein